MKRRVLFCNIGWANSYHGELDDKPTGDAKYIKEGGIGHEIANFALSDEYYYGFVETKSTNGQAWSIRIENIDSIAAQADKLDNVLVIWCATNKKRGGKYIVGWYNNATVYRNRQSAPVNSKREELYKSGILEVDDYMILCRKDDAVLIEPEKRDFKVPTARVDGYGFGQSNLWYPTKYSDEKVEKYLDSVFEYVDNKMHGISDEIKEMEPEDVYVKKLIGDDKEAIAKIRIGQSEYRKRLLKKWKKCQLCGVSSPKLLVASHIKPWCDSDALEKCDINNGILLCPNHDALFDKGLISFSKDGQILIADELAENDRLMMNVRSGQKIDYTPEMDFYLEWHRKKVFKGKH